MLSTIAAPSTATGSVIIWRGASKNPYSLMGNCHKYDDLIKHCETCTTINMPFYHKLANKNKDIH
mgnify:FL=1